MRLEWIEDILAVMSSGSLSEAAKLRYLTQPAFSRRVKLIEEYVGIELLDRTRKPAQLCAPVLAQQQKLERLAADIRDLLYAMRHEDRLVKGRVIIASQHSITSSIAPALVNALTAGLDTQVQLISANRTECISMLVTRQADVTLSYQFMDEEIPIDEEFIEQIDFGEELFIPVFQTQGLTGLNAHYRNGELPIVVYPPDVFLGKVMLREILPSLRNYLLLREKAVSSLTLAVMQLALAGVGVAWVPRTLATKEIAYGNLTDLSHLFRTEKFRINAVRLSGDKSAVEQKVWSVIKGMTH